MGCLESRYTVANTAISAKDSGSQNSTESSVHSSISQQVHGLPLSPFPCNFRSLKQDVWSQQYIEAWNCNFESGHIYGTSLSYRFWYISAKAALGKISLCHMHETQQPYKAVHQGLCINMMTISTLQRLLSTVEVQVLVM